MMFISWIVSVILLGLLSTDLGTSRLYYDGTSKSSCFFQKYMRSGREEKEEQPHKDLTTMTMRSPGWLSSLLLVFVHAYIFSQCQAFLSSKRHCHTNRSIQHLPIPASGSCCSTGGCLFGMLPRKRDDGEEAEESDYDDDDDDDDNFETVNQNIDLEKERKRLESLLGGGTSSNSPEEDSTKTTSSGRSSSSSSDETNSLYSMPFSEWKNELNKSPPPLTTIGREILEAEITLLESLAESNDALDEFWTLWYNARGPSPARDLMETESLVAQGTPQAWRQAEELLKQLIAREGIHWVEPVNRLATLMFLQSRFEESKELCEIVLTLKPWHFGALSGIVMVCQRLQDADGMVEYARQRMPPLPPKEGDGQQSQQPLSLGGQRLETRFDWVDRMLDVAQATLLRGEMGLEESFQDCDKAEETARENKSGGDDERGGKLLTNMENRKDDDDDDGVWQ